MTYDVKPSAQCLGESIEKDASGIDISLLRPLFTIYATITRPSRGLFFQHYIQFRKKNQLNTEALKRREGMKISREIIDDFSVGWTGAAMKDLSVLYKK